MSRKLPLSHSLSFKLTLCSIAMMLVMWLAVGTVLVVSTANEIIEGARSTAQSKAQEYRYDSYMMAYSVHDVEQGNWWLEHGCEIQFDFLFPRINTLQDTRYIQYNLTFQYQDANDPSSVRPLSARSLIGIRVQSPQAYPAVGTFLSLEHFSAQQLYEISGQIGSDNQELPQITATGQRDGLLFLVDTLTLGEKTYSCGSEVGTDTITLTGGGRTTYQLFPSCAGTLREWERLLDARNYAMNFNKEVHNNYFTYYTMDTTFVSLESNAFEELEGDAWEEAIDQEMVWVSVVMISTPLKTALEEQFDVLLLLFLLAPVLGLAFAWLIHRIVVVPLRRTQTDFQRVANLDFTAVTGDNRRRDEIGELNRSLKKMSEELQRRWDDERTLERRRQEFASAASHELKTPLALMRGYTEGLEQGIGNRDEYLAGLEREIDRMNTLVLELLEQTRLDGMEQLPPREQVDLSRLLDTLLHEMAPLFSGLSLKVELAQGITCLGDHTLLERGIGNLLSNAARYCAPGGSVRISLSAGPVLIVENDASPIPEADLPRLFEPFYRGDKARDRLGSGMGLAIAQRIFSLHHLKCSVENIPGGVRVRLFPEETSPC